MNVNTGQVNPGIAFYQALKGEPRAPAPANAAAKPTGPTETARAPKAPEQAAKPDAPLTDGTARHFQRGSFLDLRV